MAARSDIVEDLYCKCCINYFKRDNPSIILDGSENYLCYTTTGMCLVCFGEMNEHKFGDKFEQLLGDVVNERDQKDSK